MNKPVRTPAPAAAPVQRSNRTETLQKIYALTNSPEKRSALATLLGPGINVDLFIQVLLTAVAETPNLLDCDINSIWSAAKKAATDGLLPDGREGKIIVRSVYDKTKKKSVLAAGWQTMIAGIRKKVRRSGEVVAFTADVVYAKDFFRFAKGDEAYIEHAPTLEKDRGPIIAAYAIATLKDGEKLREVMPIHELHAIRDRYSDGWKAFKGGHIKSTPWHDSEGEMCKKTVARRLSKILPMDTDVRAVIEHDDDDVLPGAETREALPAAQARPALSDYSAEASGVTIDMTPEQDDDHALAEMAGADQGESKEEAQPASAEQKDAAAEQKAPVEQKQEGPTRQMSFFNLRARLAKAPADVQREIWDTEVENFPDLTDDERAELEALLKD